MIEFQSASRISAEQLSELMTHCFEDYVIPIQFTPQLAAFLLRVEAVDLLNTVVAFEGETVAGILMVTRREKLMRVGAMAVAKAYRGRGFGHEMMALALAAAKERGETHAVLEAIESNTRAIAFYEDFGFRKRFRLISAEYPLDLDGPSGPLEEASLAQLAVRLLSRGDGAWSWDMSPGSTMQFALPIVGYQHEGMMVAVQPAGANNLLCRAMALSGDDDVMKLSRLLRGLAHLHPRKCFKIPPYFPEPEFREVLLGAGFTLGSLTQVQMERRLDD